MLTLITPEHGKLKAIAKGIRRPTSRLGGSLEPFAELTRRAGPRPHLRRRHRGPRRPRLAPAAGLARERGHRLVPRGARRPQPRGAPRRRAAVRAAPPRLRAARRGHGARPRRPLVRDAPRRRAGPAARGGPLRRVRPDARGERVVPLGAAARRGALRRAARAPAPIAPASRLEALKVLKAYQRLDIEAIAALRLPDEVEREVESAMRDFMRIALERDPRSLAFLDEVRPTRRTARPPWSRHSVQQPTRQQEGAPDGLRLRQRQDQHALERLASATGSPGSRRDARRPAADVPGLVPLGGRRRSSSTATTGRSATRNIAANPRVSFHLEDDADGGDLVIVEGTARIDAGDALARPARRVHRPSTASGSCATSGRPTRSWPSATSCPCGSGPRAAGRPGA